MELILGDDRTKEAKILKARQLAILTEATDEDLEEIAAINNISFEEIKATQERLKKRLTDAAND